MAKKRKISRTKSRKIKKYSTNKFVNFIYSNFILGLRTVKDIRKYIYFSLILFFGFGIIGFLFPIFFKDQILKLIGDLVKQTQGLGPIELIRFIISNNIKSAFFGMIFGIFFGIVPFFVILINGYVLGFVANKTVGLEGPVILLRLLPHGIFEVPAIIIAVALGMKFGTYFFITKEKYKLKGFVQCLVDSIRVFVLVVVPLLVIAGIIEGVLIALLG